MSQCLPESTQQMIFSNFKVLLLTFQTDYSSSHCIVHEVLKQKCSQKTQTRCPQILTEPFVYWGLDPSVHRGGFISFRLWFCVVIFFYFDLVHELCLVPNLLLTIPLNSFLLVTVMFTSHCITPEKVCVLLWMCVSVYLLVLCEDHIVHSQNILGSVKEMGDVLHS